MSRNCTAAATATASREVFCFCIAAIILDWPSKPGAQNPLSGRRRFWGRNDVYRQARSSAPAHPAFIMAATGETVTYAELEARSNRLAHLFRKLGLKRLDHYAIFMENNSRYLEACGAGERSGLYFTCVNSYLTASELAYIVDNSQSRILITSMAKLDVAREALEAMPEGRTLHRGRRRGRERAHRRPAARRRAVCPTTPIAGRMHRHRDALFVGHHRPAEGHPAPAAGAAAGAATAAVRFPAEALAVPRGHDLSVAGAAVSFGAAGRRQSRRSACGGTVIIMESFDPERYLALIEKWGVTHSQLVPTMFSRMLKLPEAARQRYDLSSLEIAIHAAAPCPALVKEDMIKWWGPIIHEYYGATEGLGFTACNSAEWLAHRGTVGKVLLGDLHILDEDMQPCPVGTPGTVWFKTATPFEYFNDPNKTREARSPDGSMSTVGDVGYVDGDGFLYLTDRATFMIISGGVNIYPQECENLLITHPKIADAAVFGVPNADLGEEVKAVVQPMPGIEPGAGSGRGADRVLQPVAVAPEGAALDRLRGGTAAAADRQALQAAVARPLLGRQDLAHRVIAGQAQSLPHIVTRSPGI